MRPAAQARGSTSRLSHMFGGQGVDAGVKDLLERNGSLAPSRPRVILTHGEGSTRRALAALISERFGLQSGMPAYVQTTEA